MATTSELRNEPTGYAALLKDGGFQSFLWTQFLAAFNDNVYKMIVSVGAVELAANQLLGSRYLALAGAVFVLPFLLFAGYAGQLADRFSKTRVLQISKAFEIVIMGVGIVAHMAVDEHDPDLTGVDASHLFAAHTTWIGFRRGTLLRKYMYEFAQLLAPHLDRRLVERAHRAASAEEVAALFADSALPER